MIIWKYLLTVVDSQWLYMPQGAKLLTVQTQDGQLQLWALCEEQAPKESRLITIHGTGNPMPDEPPGIYVGTIQLSGGGLVFHVFDKGPTDRPMTYAYAHPEKDVMESLPEGLAKEQVRVRKVMENYISIGPAGFFGAHFIDQDLKRSEAAAASGDVVEMIRALNALKEIES